MQQWIFYAVMVMNIRISEHDRFYLKTHLYWCTEIQAYAVNQNLTTLRNRILVLQKH